MHFPQMNEMGKYNNIPIYCNVEHTPAFQWMIIKKKAVCTKKFIIEARKLAKFYIDFPHETKKKRNKTWINKENKNTMKINSHKQIGK